MRSSTASDSTIFSFCDVTVSDWIVDNSFEDFCDITLTTLSDNISLTEAKQEFSDEFGKVSAVDDSVSAVERSDDGTDDEAVDTCDVMTCKNVIGDDYMPRVN